MSIQETRQQANHVVLKTNERLFELLLNISAYDIIAVFMIVLAIAIERDGNNRVLLFVDDFTNGLFAPWVWKFGFLICGFAQLSGRFKDIQLVSVGLTAPMIAIGYYFMRYALSGRPGPVSPFSTLLIASMVIIMLLFILRTSGFEHYQKREQELLQEIVRLKATQVKPDEQQHLG